MDLPMRIKSDPAEEEDIKIVLVKPAKVSFGVLLFLSDPGLP